MLMQWLTIGYEIRVDSLPVLVRSYHSLLLIILRVGKFSN